MAEFDADLEFAKQLSRELNYRRNTFIQDFNAKSSDDQHKLLEVSRNIILPEAALNTLASQCDFPYLMKITNKKYDLSTYCGVQEFSANPSEAILPRSVHQLLQLSHQEKVECEHVKLEKATQIFSRF